MREREVEFKGLWSEREKQLWKETNWEERDYEDLPIEDDTFLGTGYFYSNKGVNQAQVEFVKYIVANPIYPPYYGPIYSSSLLTIMEEGFDGESYLRAMFDGHTHNDCKVHDRFETQEVYDALSK